MRLCVSVTMIGVRDPGRLCFSGSHKTSRMKHISDKVLGAHSSLTDWDTAAFSSHQAQPITAVQLYSRVAVPVQFSCYGTGAQKCQRASTGRNVHHEPARAFMREKMDDY